MTELFGFFTWCPVPALLHDVEFRAFDQFMCTLHRGERDCRIWRATKKQGRCGDLMEPVGEIAAQAIPEDFISLERDKCFACFRLVRLLVDLFKQFRRGDAAGYR